MKIMKKRLFTAVLASALLLSSCRPLSLELPFPAETTADSGVIEPSALGEADGTPCPKCGFVMRLADDGLSYILEDDGIDEVTEGDGSLDLVIPAEHNGLPVSGIKSGAFWRRDDIGTVTLPSTLTDIATQSFAHCANLKYNTYKGASYLGTAENPYEYLIGTDDAALNILTAHSNTRVIAENAFNKAGELRSVMLGEKVEYICKMAFFGCEKLTSVYLGSSLRGIREHAFWNCTALAGIIMPDKLAFVGLGAFAGCTSLPSIALPDSLKRIDDEAFSACGSLTQVDFGEGIEHVGAEAFSSCISLRSVRLPESTRFVGENAFSGCSALGNVVVHEGLKEIYTNSFPVTVNYTSFGGGLYLGCKDNPHACLIAPSETAQKLTLHGNTDSIAYGALASSKRLSALTADKSCKKYSVAGNCIIEKSSGRLIFGIKTSVIPADGSVTAVGDRAFAGNEWLTKISIPASVTLIEDRAFADCPNLTSLTLSEGLGEIGAGAFEDCRALSSVSFPKTLKKVGANAFSHAESIAKLDLGEVEVLGESAFASCGITELQTPKSLTSLPENAFINCGELREVVMSSVAQIGEGAFQNCRMLERISFSEELTAVGAHAFDSCRSLVSVSLPESVRHIGDGAFRLCESLASIEFPEGIEYFGKDVLAATALKELTLPRAKTFIGREEFYGCKSLQTIRLHSGITELGDGAFHSSRELKTIIYDGTVAEWNAIQKAELWYRCTSGMTVRCSDGVITVPEDNSNNIW